MTSPSRRPRALVVTVPLLGFQLAGMFLLPALTMLLGAMFLEVSEVAETSGALGLLTAAVLLPVALLQVAGLAWKSAKELRFWRSRGALDASRTLDVLATHAGVITLRGWTLLIIGCVLTLVALGMQWASFGLLAMIGLLLFYLVTGWTLFASTFLVRTFERGVAGGDAAVRRQMVPSVVQAGEAVDEVFRLERVPVPAGYLLILEDPLHPRLRTESRYSVGARVRGGEVVVTGGLRATPRGYYEVGPARLWYQDLLGLTRASVASVATAALKVLPRIRPVIVIEPPKSPSQQPDVLTRPHRFPTEDHFRFREYAAGDDTRRIQWRLSLKHGHLQVRLPETKETTTSDITLVLDTYVTPKLRPEAERGADALLDELVDAWIGLAAELVRRGDRVTLVAAVRQHGSDTIQVERTPARPGESARWQDLGARVAWQSERDIDTLLEGTGSSVHAVVATARVLGPPPGRLAGADLTWIVVDAGRALGPEEAHWLWQLTGSGPLAAAAWAVRLPHPTGSEENNFVRRARSTWRLAQTWRARKTLRNMVRTGGTRLVSELAGRGDAVYLVEAGPRMITFRGVSGQRSRGKP